MMHLERTGRRTLILMAVWGALGIVAIITAAAAQESRPDPSSKQPGRYQIFMHPTFRADQYLVDTVTGQIWQMTKFSGLKGEPEVWKYMTRIDNEADYVAFIMSKPSKPAAEASTPTLPARPKQPSPMKLN